MTLVLWAFHYWLFLNLLLLVMKPHFTKQKIVGEMLKTLPTNQTNLWLSQTAHVKLIYNLVKITNVKDKEQRFPKGQRKEIFLPLYHSQTNLDPTMCQTRRDDKKNDVELQLLLEISVPVCRRWKALPRCKRGSDHTAHELSLSKTNNSWTQRLAST